MKWQYSVLEKFKRYYYSQTVTASDLIEEIVIQDQTFWLVHLNKVKYLLDVDLIDELPIRITRAEEVPFRNKLYHHVIGYQAVKVLPEHKMSFKELVDGLDLEHSNPEDFLVLKLLALASYCGRVNFRVAAPAGFGKDSVFSILKLLTNHVSVVNPRTVPAVEYRLENSVLVLNELSNLGSEQKKLLQELLLLVGDYKSFYEKSSRGTNGGKDVYDISDLSMVILYNPLQYYAKVGGESKFFDNVFTEAVLDRFVPFKLEGKLDMSQFKTLTGSELDKVFLSSKDYLLDFLKSLEWYKHHYLDEAKGKGWSVNWDLLPEIRGRHVVTFEKLLPFLKLYASTLEEFDYLVKLFYNRFLQYKKMLKSGEGFGKFESFEEPVEEVVVG